MSRPQKCPRCGQGTAPVMFGFPSPEAFELADRGELILGGCVLPMGQLAEFGCLNSACRLQFSSVRPRPKERRVGRTRGVTVEDLFSFIHSWTGEEEATHRVELTGFGFRIDTSPRLEAFEILQLPIPAPPYRPELRGQLTELSDGPLIVDGATGGYYGTGENLAEFLDEREYSARQDIREIRSTEDFDWWLRHYPGLPDGNIRYVATTENRPRRRS